MRISLSSLHTYPLESISYWCETRVSMSVMIRTLKSTLIATVTQRARTLLGMNLVILVANNNCLSQT